MACGVTPSARRSRASSATDALGQDGADSLQALEGGFARLSAIQTALIKARFNFQPLGGGGPHRRSALWAFVNRASRPVTLATGRAEASEHAGWCWQGAIRRRPPKTFVAGQPPFTEAPPTGGPQADHRSVGFACNGSGRLDLVETLVYRRRAGPHLSELALDAEMTSMSARRFQPATCLMIRGVPAP